MNKLLELVEAKGILISDGAWGTLLQAQGLNPGECPELWNIQHPEKVKAVAQAYVNAGADLIETNSFGASRFKLNHYGLGDQTSEINRRAAEISRSAAGNASLVMGSVGPTGVMLLMGEVSPEELYDAFKEQVIALEAGGAQAICIETMTDLEEATLAVRAAKDHTSLEVICTMTFDKTIQGDFKTMMGVDPAQMLERLLAAGVDVIGTNCGNGMENMIPIVQEIRKINTSIPILVHANAGLPELRDGKNFFNETPEVTASFLPELIASGANIIGGCCGTTPAHIEKIKQTVSRQHPS